jgi:hypothetical protein
VFEAAAFRHADLHYVELTIVFRQSDESMIQRLQALRNPTDRAKVQAAKNFFNRECRRPLVPPEGIRPTRLYPTNRKADEKNKDELKLLAGPMHGYVEATHYLGLRFHSRC